ncbi:NAD-dependent epimerase, partial [candidate division bacterium WOR-3 4484_18]
MLDLNGNHVLVTGGAGFIGSHIVDALVACGADVVVYDNFTRGKIENLESALSTGKVEVIEGDIRDTAKLDKAMESVDYVFHEAALWLLECEQNPRLAIDVNIIGTFNVLEAA